MMLEEPPRILRLIHAEHQLLTQQRLRKIPPLFLLTQPKASGAKIKVFHGFRGVALPYDGTDVAGITGMLGVDDKFVDGDIL